MNIENMENNLVREEDLMTPEELAAWEAQYANSIDLGEDPLELLGQNRGHKKEEIKDGNGPDDGDML